MNKLNQKIELARESYSIKFLNDKFENKDDNKLRRDKLNKLMENKNEHKSFTNIKS
jgi:hypothetical protein